MAKAFALTALSFTDDRRVHIAYEVDSDVVTIDTNFMLEERTFANDNARETARLVLAHHLGSHAWVTPQEIEAEIDRLLPYVPASGAYIG